MSGTIITIEDRVHVEMEISIEDILDFVRQCDDEETNQIISALRNKNGYTELRSISKPSLLDMMTDELLIKARKVYSFWQLENILKL